MKNAIIRFVVIWIITCALYFVADFLCQTIGINDFNSIAYKIGFSFLATVFTFTYGFVASKLEARKIKKINSGIDK